MSRLLVPSSVLLELPVTAAPAGLRARGGAVLESVGTAANGASVARVRGVVPASGQATFGVEPIAPGSGSPGQAAPASTTVGGPTSFQGSGGGGGGGGCALETSSGSPGAALPLFLLVGLLLAKRRR